VILFVWKGSRWANCQTGWRLLSIPSSPARPCWFLGAPPPREISLVKGIQAVPIRQPTRDHAPQAKVLELFAAILKGSA
jgi:hypothetical protein